LHHNILVLITSIHPNQLHKNGIPNNVTARLTGAVGTDLEFANISKPALDFNNTFTYKFVRASQMILTDRRDLCYMSVQAMTRATTLVVRAYSNCATAHTHKVSRRTVIRPYYNYRKTPTIYRIPVDVMRAKNSLSAGRLPTAYGAVGEGNGLEDQHSRLGGQAMSRL